VSKMDRGAPRTIDESVRTRICVIAGCDPRILRQAFSTWSLSKLRDYLMDTGVVEHISRETLRRILHAGGISWQATKTWKASNDPDFAAKTARILDLYDDPPADSRVVCVDEFGPLNLLPRKGKKVVATVQTTGAVAGDLHPHRGRATHARRAGPDNREDHLPDPGRKRGREFLDFCKTLRRRWPNQRLYLVLDNYGPHKRPEVLTWCQAHNIELVFTPTNASWLNWIECEFTALRYFALAGTDHRSHHEQNAAIAAYIRCRNNQAHPKQHFAINSSIRQPDYMINVAGHGTSLFPAKP
jgi:hypothetical protein